jgi:hypothetical protein
VKQGGTAFDGATNGNKFVYTLQFLGAQTHGHAQFAQVAIRASDFDGFLVHACIFNDSGQFFKQ